MLRRGSLAQAPRRQARLGLLAIAGTLLLAVSAWALTEVGLIITVAGTGFPTFFGDGGPATNANIALPNGVAVDQEGNFYIADTINHRLRRVDAATGIITTVAGTGVSGFTGDGVAATATRLNNPTGIAVDAAGNIFFSDRNNQRVRRVDASTGIITTVAGIGTVGFSGDGGSAASAQLTTPEGIALDADGNLFIADSNNHRVRRVDALTGTISTVAGNGTAGYSGDGAPAINASLYLPSGVAVDTGGNLLIADTNNRRIRRVDALTGNITTVSGNGLWGFSGDGGPATDARLTAPTRVKLDAAGNLFIADRNNNRIRRVDASTGNISTVAGNGTFGPLGDNGPATDAGLIMPNSVALGPAGNLFVADTWNSRIRFVQLVEHEEEAPPASGNQPPAADAGPDQTIECASHAGAAVTLNGSASSDPDGDALSFDWTDSNGAVVGTTAVVNLIVPGGSHTFTLTVDDGNGGTSADTVTITVADTSPPALSVTLSPSSLWPPNHKLVEITATVTTADACDSSPAITLISVTSNEPDNGLGDGDTANDIQGAAIGADNRSFFLRAERQGRGLGRLYTITYRATDASGNLTETTAQVLVPVSRGRAVLHKAERYEFDRRRGRRQ